MLTAILLITLVLAAVNGANDNIKGTATLFGSGVVGYRVAITLATLATAAGGVASIFLANGLLVAFSGKGIVPQDVATSLPFMFSVGFAAALTVGAATRAGLPISTTHALLGALAGAPGPGRQIVAVDAAVGIDRLHLLTAAAVSFARGLNDTPKIAALMVAAGALSAAPATVLVAAAMATGGYLAARRVANTLAFGVTRMDPGQGLGANLVTSLLVIFASRFGMPVSTTHVSAGALFGIAASSRSGHPAVIRNIVLAWLLTLPVAAICAYASYSLLTR